MSALFFVTLTQTGAAPTLVCQVELPAGWSSGQPMPGHLLELWSGGGQGTPRAELIVKEGPPAKTLDEAVRTVRARAAEGFGSGVEFVSDEPIAGAMAGRLVKHRSPGLTGGPPRTHWTAVYRAGPRVLQAVVYPDDATDSPALRKALTTLRCVPDDEAFWALIEATRRPTPDAHLEALRLELQRRSPRELGTFTRLARGWFHALNRNDLWAACVAFRGGCSDDAFMDFREWLILRGRAVVMASIRDPDSLAGISVKAEPRASGLLHLASDVAEARGLQVEHEFVPLDTSTWPADRLGGPPWDEATTRRLFPRLNRAEPWRRWAAP